VTLLFVQVINIPVDTLLTVRILSSQTHNILFLIIDSIFIIHTLSRHHKQQQQQQHEQIFSAFHIRHFKNHFLVFEPYRLFFVFRAAIELKAIL
jgi:hypothetical protein